MNESNPESAPVESSPAPYKDRSVGLIIFGILTIILGSLAGLFVLLMLAGQGVAAEHRNGPAPFSQMLFVISIYGLLAVVLIWLGIGSIMARRWARALLLIFSWGWLVMGVFVLIFMVFLMPRMLATISSCGTTSPQPPIAAIMFFMFLFFGFFFVVCPAVWTFFYSSRHVKATCEARDNMKRWTDACPLPVLGFCLWLSFGGLAMLLIPFASHCVAPFFGMLLSGLPGVIFFLAASALWLYAAWLLYKLDARGWWLILIALCLSATSSLLTFTRHDLLEMYRLMDYPPAQIEQMQKTGLFEGNRFAWIMCLSMLPFLCYLLFIRKYLPRKS